MHLFEETQKAQRLRRNIVVLLGSKSRANQLLGLEMIKSGGLHWELFLHVDNAFHTHRHPFSSMEKMVLELLATSKNPPSLIQYFQENIRFTGGLGMGPENKIFNETELFELLINEGIVDFQRLGELWKQDTLLQGNHHLITFLIDNIDQFDPNLVFISPDISVENLNRFEMKALLEGRFTNFDKLGFLKQYVRDGKRLDLSNTGIDRIPEEASLLNNIETLDLSATRVGSLPNGLLRTVRKVDGNRKCLRKIRSQVTAGDAEETPLAVQFRLSNAIHSLGSKQYQTAFDLFRQIEGQVLESRGFTANEVGSFWEGYFHATYRKGQVDYALEVLEKSIRIAPADFGPFQWKWGEQYVRKILRLGSQKKWMEAVAAIKKKDPRYSKVFNLSNPRFWQRYFQSLVAKREFEEAFRMLEVSSKYLELNSGNFFPWLELIQIYHQEENWNGIVDIFMRSIDFILAWYEGVNGHPRHKMKRSYLLIDVFDSIGRHDLLELWIGNLQYISNKGSQTEHFNDFYRNRYMVWENEPILKAYVKLYANSRPTCSRHFKTLLVEVHSTIKSI